MRATLNTPKALAALHDLASELNKAADAESKARLKTALREGGELLGLLGGEPDAWFKRAGPGTARGADGGLDAARIGTMIARRAEAREKRDFTAADAIRDSLAEAGVVLEDRPDGTTDWRRAG